MLNTSLASKEKITIVSLLTFSDKAVPAVALHLSSRQFVLPENEVHVWSLQLDTHERILPALLNTLSPNEKEKASQFCLQKDRKRYIACRGILRVVLGSYLGIEPQRVRILVSRQGKPFLSQTSPSESAAISFNLSHKKGLGLLALAPAKSEIGVDLEFVTPFSHLERMIERCLTRQERAAVGALSEDKKLVAFFRYWTFKEAYLKAAGWPGSQAPMMNKIDLSILQKKEGRAPTLFSDYNSGKGNNPPPQWSFYELTPEDGYVGALVVQGKGHSLKYRHYQ